MQWELAIALVIVIPVILFPAAYVWYLNIGDFYTAIRETRARRAARGKGDKITVDIKQTGDL